MLSCSGFGSSFNSASITHEFGKSFAILASLPHLCNEGALLAALEAHSNSTVPDPLIKLSSRRLRMVLGRVVLDMKDHNGICFSGVRRPSSWLRPKEEPWG